MAILQCKVIGYYSNCVWAQARKCKPLWTFSYRPSVQLVRPQVSDLKIFWAADKIQDHAFFLDNAVVCSVFPVTAERIAEVERADFRCYRAVGGTLNQHCGQITKIIDISFEPVTWVFQVCDSQNSLLGKDLFTQNMLSWKFYLDEYKPTKSHVVFY